MNLTPQQVEEVIRMKRYFPCRIVFGILHPKTGEFRVRTCVDDRTPKRWASRGWLVFKTEG